MRTKCFRAGVLELKITLAGNQVADDYNGEKNVRESR